MHSWSFGSALANKLTIVLKETAKCYMDPTSLLVSPCCTMVDAALDDRELDAGLARWCGKK